MRTLTGLLGLNGQLMVDGVRYKERHAMSLERALGPKGKGTKAYEVRFPTGRPMTINATETRRFADLMDVPALRSLLRAQRFVTPGDRVLVLGSGTGAIADLVAQWTGPHGGVVALEHDHESVRYARRRYAPVSTSLERGGPELLAGEVDGSFEVVVVDLHWLHACQKPRSAWDELWRVVAREGRVIFIGVEPGPGAEHPNNAPRVPEGEAVRAERVIPPAGAPLILVLTRILDSGERGAD